MEPRIQGDLSVGDAHQALVFLRDLSKGDSGGGDTFGQ